jgi:hypothetical protein
MGQDGAELDSVDLWTKAFSPAARACALTPLSMPKAAMAIRLKDFIFKIGGF